jgi:hypothetical protein
MVQLDGSHHDWFEGRREPCVLMVMVDDATNRMWARFFEEETTPASDDVFEGWGHRHRLPRSLYVDRDSPYRCEGVGSLAEQLAGNGRVQLVYQGKQLKWRALPEGAMHQPAQAKRVKTPTTVKPPSANHLWRRFGMGVGRNYWRGVKAHGRAERLGLRDSGRPALRSGLPAARNPNRGKGATNNNQKRGHSLVS